jgi:hypothetical protein
MNREGGFRLRKERRALVFSLKEDRIPHAAAWVHSPYQATSCPLWASVIPKAFLPSPAFLSTPNACLRPTHTTSLPSVPISAQPALFRGTACLLRPPIGSPRFSRQGQHELRGWLANYLLFLEKDYVCSSNFVFVSSDCSLIKRLHRIDSQFMIGIGKS